MKTDLDQALYEKHYKDLELIKRLANEPNLTLDHYRVLIASIANFVVMKLGDVDNSVRLRKFVREMNEMN